MILRCCLISLLFSVGTVCGIDYAPWYKTSFEFRPEVETLYQHYQTVRTACGKQPYRSNDWFVRGSFGTTILGEWDGSVEATLAFTKRQVHDVDNITVVIRHLLMDDITLDPVSVSAGLAVITAFRHSVRDLSSFHHGKNELEFHVSVGKEWSTGAIWNTRLWGMAAFGIALDQGSPWGRAQLQWEKNRCDWQKFFIFGQALWGFGHKQLCELDHFKGYGLVEHRSIDLGIGFQTHVMESYIVQLKSSLRVWSENFPSKALLVFLSIERPFGL